MKLKEKLEARRLRKEEGLSLKEIAERLNVAKSSVSLWVRDVELTDDQIAVLAEKSCHYKQAGCRWSEINREKRREYRQRGKDKVAKNIDLFVAGCMMYWSEGAKDRNSARLANTDVFFLKLYKKFLVDCFDVKENELKLHIHCYLDNGKDLDNIESYWCKELNLSRDAFMKTTIVKKHPMSKGLKKNKHPHGVATLVLNRTDVVQEIFGAIEKISGYNEPRWLD